MAITTIGTGGLSNLEKAQYRAQFSQTQASSLISNLPTSSAALDGSLLYDIYDQQAITPRIRAVLAAKENADSSSDSSTETASTSVNDTLIAENRSASSSDVPASRPAHLVNGISNVDLSA